VDHSGTTIIVNGSVAFQGSRLPEWGLPLLVGVPDEETASIQAPGGPRVPGFRHDLAYEQAARFTVDLALAHALRGLR
jgi:hypothetical protein